MADYDHIKSRMKLEDCTKEELIYFIRRNAFVDMDRLEFDMLMCRSATAAQKAKHERDCAMKALAEYIKLLRPYEGKPMVEVPNRIIEKASSASERYKQHEQSAARYDKQYSKIQEQIDRNLRERSAANEQRD